MRIGLCNSLFQNYSGIELLMCKVAEAVVHHNHELIILDEGLHYDGPFPITRNSYLTPFNLPNRILRRYRNHFLSRSFRKFGDSADLWVVGHLHLLPPILEARKSNSIKTPIILLTHGAEVWDEWNPVQKSALLQCDLIVAVSSYTAESIRQRLPEDQKSRVCIIHPCVDFRELQDQPSHDLDKKPHILTVSRLDSNCRYKGHHIILEAIPSLEEKLGRKVQYTIVGQGPLQNDLREQAQALGILDRVEFTGRVDLATLSKLYQKAWVFAMPSSLYQNKQGQIQGEGFGIVYIEAGYFGTPVIASKVGGQTDCVVDDRTGYLVDAEPDSVEEALYRVLKDQTVARQMGLQARDYVLSNFQFSLFSTQWNEVWQQLEQTK